MGFLLQRRGSSQVNYQHADLVITKLTKPHELSEKKQYHNAMGMFSSHQVAAKCFKTVEASFSTLIAGGRTLAFHGYSIWLFTVSDLKTILGPSLIFGTSNALAVANYDLGIPILRNGLEIGLRTPLVVLWIWINLLPFTINNQTAADAIEEDRINKPWRTLPTGRMTPSQAKCLMLALYPLALVTTFLTGGLRQSIGLVFFGIWYNNFAGGDGSCLVRNMINAYGYVCFTSGAMEVAIGAALPLEMRLWQRFGIIAGIVFSTVHLQDMYDQKGDRIKGRRTVPLVVGDGRARWSIGLAMIFWGYVCPVYWRAGILVATSSIVLASTVAARGLLLRSVDSDRLTFKLWNAWMTLVFVMPLVSRK
ncbi:MAG: hypothetical protein Q9166_005663 [cf. Caloplaca sp. 2 TL-2023]